MTHHPPGSLERAELAVAVAASPSASPAGSGSTSPGVDGQGGLSGPGDEDRVRYLWNGACGPPQQGSAHRVATPAGAPTMMLSGPERRAPHASVERDPSHG